MELDHSSVQTLTIEGKKTLSCSLHKQLTFFIFFDGEGELSDMSYILPFRSGQAAIVRDCEQIILSNSSAMPIKVGYMPVNPETYFPDLQYRRLISVLSDQDNVLTILPFREEDFADIEHYYSLIHHEQFSSRLYAGRTTSILLSLLSGYIARSLALSQEKELNVRDNPAQRMRAEIDAHYDRPLSLEYFSSQFGLSVPYLSKIFHEANQVSFSAYLSQVRIRQACTLLEDSNELITDVAMDVGFTNPSYFCTAFRKITGESPNQYRKNHRRRQTFNDPARK